MKRCTCASENLLSIITCSGCQENYIGQTRNTIKKQMTENAQEIRVPSTRKIALCEHNDICAGLNHPKFPYFSNLSVFT